MSFVANGGIVVRIGIDIPNRIKGVFAICTACRKRIQSFNFVCRSQIFANFNLNKWQSNCMQHVKRKVRRAVRNYKQDGELRLGKSMHI